jgi:hypothetical protein
LFIIVNPDTSITFSHCIVCPSLRFLITPLVSSNFSQAKSNYMYYTIGTWKSISSVDEFWKGDHWIIYFTVEIYSSPGPMRGGSVCLSVQGLWISAGPHSLSHGHFIFIFSYFGYFQLFLVYLDKTNCPWGSKAVLLSLAKFLLETQLLSNAVNNEIHLYADFYIFNGL